jgi:methyl-accepting chemotaxis protein
MRAWQVIGKYPIYTDGKVTHTEITLATMSGSYGTFTERVVGDQTGKTNDELIELARDAYFKTEYADKAMPEAVQKVDEMSVSVDEANKKLVEVESSIGNLKAMVTTVTSAVAEAKEETAKTVVLVKNATDSVNQLMEILSLIDMSTDETAEENGGQTNEN